MIELPGTVSVAAAIEEYRVENDQPLDLEAVVTRRRPLVVPGLLAESAGLLRVRQRGSCGAHSRGPSRRGRSAHRGDGRAVEAGCALALLTSRLLFCQFLPQPVCRRKQPGIAGRSGCARRPARRCRSKTPGHDQPAGSEIVGHQRLWRDRHAQPAAAASSRKYRCGNVCACCRGSGGRPIARTQSGHAFGRDAVCSSGSSHGALAGSLRRRSAPGSPSADRCGVSTGRSRRSRCDRGITQRASTLPEQPSTKAELAWDCRSRVQAFRSCSKVLAQLSLSVCQASVSATSRPWRTSTGWASASSSARTWRLIALWVTCSACAARLMLPSRGRPR